MFSSRSFRFTIWAFVVPAVLVALSGPSGGFPAGPDFQNSDPAQWSNRDVYEILNNSPWTKSVKYKPSGNDGSSLGNQGPNNGGTSGNWGNNGQMPPNMGRRGVGGRSAGGSYPSGGGGSSRPSSSGGGPQNTEVLVQWQSALPVRAAAAIKAGNKAEVDSLKPLDEYVIAVIGLPMTALGARAASLDSDQTVDADQERRIADRVKTSASIVRSGHDPLTPTKVELDQGADGRMLIHFSKADPIAPGEKNVEFRLQAGREELRKKFTLKEMEYHGKLEL